MGKIKTKLIKRAARELMNRGVEFSENFEENKSILKEVMPSKKVRNQVSGLLARIKKQSK